MSGYYLALAACLLLVVLIIALLRKGRLGEKYAAIWLTLAIAVCVIGAFPSAVQWLADLVLVETASNLLFALAIIVLLGVCIQLSVETTSLEEETRTLAEEVAMLRLDLDNLRGDIELTASNQKDAAGN